jgi:hypothetical protein
VKRPVQLWIAMMIVSATLLAQAPSSTQSREFPFPEASLKAALQNIGGYGGGRLPSLEGFIAGDNIHPEEYQRPYYEYKIEVVPSTAGQSKVSVTAKVSAWYASPNGEGAYRTLESNGHLESDLLDRLSEYLENKSADPAVLQVRIKQVEQQKEDASARLAQLQAQLEQTKTAPPSNADKEYASITKAQTPIVSTPVDAAKILLKAQADDEFEVLESRGAWLRVALEGAQQGWVRRSQVRIAGMKTSDEQIASSKKTEFSIIREMSSDFSGDLAQLKGKRALYIWARPEGSGLNLTGNKLQFANDVFLQRYREISHASQNAVAGVVVIFLDEKGGVAAASLDDIRLFADGSLSRDAFLKKCSFDPPSAFSMPRAD